ncbi:hypothetical protein ACE7GA_16400 [Roseomonas sp. CCTCC AB2023176]|uniref:hypothetical protein n=1 Tax=Roseomonas sp. CCTCC AB2023176 TaxID=3342640 RepID=UPI0035E01034
MDGVNAVAGPPGRDAAAGGRPVIPVLDLRDEAFPAAAACTALPLHVGAIVGAAVRHYTATGVSVGDAISRRWLGRNGSAYRAEVDAVARVIGRPGVHLLNASFEWACTTGAAPDGRGGMTMTRVLDWPFDGLGRTLTVIRQRGPAGIWLNLGWPGFVGCITGLAPGRFAAAINQPPLPETRAGAAARARGWHRPAFVADWLAERPATWRTDAPPPSHLLRRAMDEACGYDEAVEMLTATPIAAPALFAVAGPREGQGVVIERGRTTAALRHAAPAVAVANHWDALPIRGAPRWRDSEVREACLAELIGAVPEHDPLRLPAPVLNELTRLVAVMHPATGRVSVAGYEAGRRATELLVLDAA